MKTLTKELTKIMRWLEKYQPDYAASFMPGLEYQEIQLVEVQLGFPLPKEIYELYQWRNGTEEDNKAVCFPTMQFLPIHKALEYTKGCNEYINEFSHTNSLWYETSPLFIFIQNNCDFCGVPVVNLPKDNIPVVILGEAEMPAIFYTSITSMMQTLAECYETGAYYLGLEGFVEANESRVADIFRKYNNLKNGI